MKLALIAAAMLIGAATVWKLDLLPREIDCAGVEAMVVSVGALGPVLVVVLMTLAVVASPIPSAPIALAAGAAYGHYAGTLYVALGSEIGAMIAFAIARWVGREPLERVLGEKADYGLLGSQNALTFTVFFSRLLPFVSFDAMSYAAGLSKLHFWRFALATLAGIVPASFLLAHVGAAAMDGGYSSAEWLVFGLGLATALPVLFLAIRSRRR